MCISYNQTSKLTFFFCCLSYSICSKIYLIYTKRLYWLVDTWTIPFDSPFWVGSVLRFILQSTFFFDLVVDDDFFGEPHNIFKLSTIYQLQLIYDMTIMTTNEEKIFMSSFSTYVWCWSIDRYQCSLSKTMREEREWE